jgi:uncharacterized OsmC-like protein
MRPRIESMLHEVTVKNCPVDILLQKAGVKIEYNVKFVKE